ncbi:MAG: hypothetical protein DHS20C13_13310 [Thermodesulfobacteriota bacterium]|nr:MAG: hypothetical protein DHS20C13_13310 [Thermodesulfobacteriota bacterium]
MRLNNSIFIFLLIISFLLVFALNPVSAQDTDGELKILKEEIRRLNQRVEDLEKQRAEEKKMVEQVIRDQEESQEQASTSIGSYVDERIQKFGIFNTSKTLFTGYGAVGFNKADGNPSTFSAVFAPVFHYQLYKNLHVIIEPEFELEDDELEIGLEIGEIDFFLNDYVTLSAGKIILPFNVFSQRFHPTWINKMPSRPIIYGGHDEGGIVPVLSDIGAQVSGGFALNMFEGSKINYAFYLVNGPRIESEDDHGEESGGDDNDETTTTANEGDEPEENGNGGTQTNLVFGNNFTDINSNKAFGGRIGLLPVWNWEVGGSLMFGDAEDDINFFMYGFDTEYQYRGLLVLAEFIHLKNDNVGSGETKKTGYYAQGSYRLSDISIENRYLGGFINGLEPVFRYGKNYLPGRDEEQYAIGLDWWLLSSVPLKIAYEFNDGLPDRVLLQWAFGF